VGDRGPEILGPVVTGINGLALSASGADEAVQRPGAGGTFGL